MYMSPETKPSSAAHHCNCKDVTKCQIFVHPDPGVTAALNKLVEEMTRYDEETGAISAVIMHSDRHDGGTFHSETRNAAQHKLLYSRIGDLKGPGIEQTSDVACSTVEQLCEVCKKRRAVHVVNGFPICGYYDCMQVYCANSRTESQ